MSELRGQLLSAYQEGNFLKQVYELSLDSKDNRESISQELANLHNEGLINVVQAFKNLSTDSQQNADFFLTRNIFKEALPLFDADIAEVMHCVLALYRNAGHDLAAPTVIGAFSEYCCQDTKRPIDALDQIETDKEALFQLLPSVISDGSKNDFDTFSNHAIRLCSSEDINIHRSAVHALGTLTWKDDTTPVPERLINTLETVVEGETDDDTLGSTVRSACALLKQDPSRQERLAAVTEIALSAGGDSTLHAAAEVFGFRSEYQTPDFISILTRHLLRVKPENLGTIRNIDFGIAELIVRDDTADSVIVFLEELIIRLKDALTIENFKSTTSKIIQDHKLLNRLTTRWFLTGNQALCESIVLILRGTHGNDPGITADDDELQPVTSERVLFLARKAIGYLFHKPVTAASILVSMLKLTEDTEAISGIEHLLFNPLLMNYSGDLQEYLNREVENASELVRSTINDAQDREKKYMEGLQSVGYLPALFPSQSQREAYRRHSQGLFEKSHDDAKEGYIYHQITTEMILLYGRKSIQYIYPPGSDKPHRTEAYLENHSFSMEYPRMDHINSYDLSTTLLYYRFEQPAS